MWQYFILRGTWWVNKMSTKVFKLSCGQVDFLLQQQRQKKINKSGGKSLFFQLFLYKTPKANHLPTKGWVTWLRNHPPGIVSSDIKFHGSLMRLTAQIPRGGWRKRVKLIVILSYRQCFCVCGLTRNYNNVGRSWKKTTTIPTPPPSTTVTL